MFRKLNRKKGQNTAEYAVLIALVIGAVIAMQVYVKRALQARVYDASNFLTSDTAIGGATTNQYEPYYLESNFTVARNSESIVNVVGGDDRTVMTNSTSNITRGEGGFQQFNYTAPVAGDGG